MGSLENGVYVKKASLHASSLSRLYRHPAILRPRPRLTRFLLFEKVDYIQWMFAAAVFFVVGILCQVFLPGLITENPESSDFLTGYLYRESDARWSGLDMMKKYNSSRLLEKFDIEAKEAASARLTRPRIRSALRKPLLAMVFPDLSMDSVQLLMVSVAISLQEIGYSVQVYSLNGGSLQPVWNKIGVPVNILHINQVSDLSINWLIYDGILLHSLEIKVLLMSLLQEPFRSLPILWTIHESTLALRLRHYTSGGQAQVINRWKYAFDRATVIVFPNYDLLAMYSALDAENFVVIPGFTLEALEAASFTVLNDTNELRANFGFELKDFVVAIVGSQFMYKSLWVEHALILHALLPLCTYLSFTGHRLRIGILGGNSTSIYNFALETISRNLGFSVGSVQYIGADRDVSSFLRIADLVIYGSFIEKESFPPVLVQAMCFGKLVICPDLAIIKKYVYNGVNGYHFPKDNIHILTQLLSQVISNGKLSPAAQEVALSGKARARDLMVSDTIEGYVSLLEHILRLPSEVSTPKGVDAIPQELKEAWQWHLFEEISELMSVNRTNTSCTFLDRIEDLGDHTAATMDSNLGDIGFFVAEWEQEKSIETVNAKRKWEEEELKERTDQPRGTWEEVYRSAKRADRITNELHERDERELERTGQSLCIYEPYFGEGTWPFLHQTSLYRGIGLSVKGRRPGIDDIDASARIPLLSDPYYRDTLDEYGAFFAIANKIDRIHKNAWIGFQSWKATARNDSLSKIAENFLLEAIESQRYGDTFFFWVRMDEDPRNPSKQDFWTFCDAVNAGNCRFAVSETLRRMYGIQDKDSELLPLMADDGGSWSVMHSWALPTRSFLEFVMFSRMFIDAMDAHMYDEHHKSGYCYLSLSKDPHCYSRVLELLVNIWAYHSARHMVYVNPRTGSMSEHHQLLSRRGQMRVRWFTFSTLKSMDEDLAEELELDGVSRRWLWPATGEVFWHGMYERERSQQHKQKERRKQQSRDKLQRMRKKYRQKTLGKYVRPPQELNSTLA